MNGGDHVPLPPVPIVAGQPDDDPYARLSFAPASQAQILRSHQRDISQIGRLTELVSEVMRSLVGTRWLAHRQSIIDLLVKAVYLTLTFGRGFQTLGEEYTDILPYASTRRRRPSSRRRLLTIMFLLLPSMIASAPAITSLRPPPESNGQPETLQTRIRRRLADVLASPLGQTLPEIHVVLFMFGGRFFEFARRLTGLTYISTLPARPPEAQVPSYEPLGVLMLLPILFRLFPRRQTPPVETPSDSSVTLAKHPILPLSPPLTPPLTPNQNILLAKDAAYDTPNTYLTPEAQALPERQCTLCLEPRGTGEGSGGTVAVTECGHVFCWGCLGGLEKPECPLCRQTLRMERLIAAYNL